MADGAVPAADYDPTLDFFSDQFDPFKALSTPGLRPPVPRTQVYDNLAMYESVQKRKSEPTTSAGDKRKKEKVVTSIVRKWLPHQCESTSFASAAVLGRGRPTWRPRLFC